ncbi:hypothetical protein CWE09_05865 [Aliidiomarina minuta]|uniref:Uncharacterized protein n=1 Tax=Aliidiomarina minuta TaxID=880057 RepID=A0A432W893_9GAMM|nr:hypothetical protein [Aliidiomarina minuta]RUO26241.1 hypothetical protein CWE09_05865 [Aliidiomarina minuta]
MAQWTKRQLDCLQEIGIPLWKFKVAEGPAAVEPAPEAEPVTYAFYRLGPWVFRFDHRLPVTGLGWLQDLAVQAAEKPVEINGPSSAEAYVDGQPYTEHPLTPEQKRQLWQQLSSWLS